MSSPAQPIINWRDKIREWAEKAAKPVSTKDTAWHDEMVRKATDSFKKPTTMKVAGKPKTATAKKPATKRRPTKLVAGK